MRNLSRPLEWYPQPERLSVSLRPDGPWRAAEGGCDGLVRLPDHPALISAISDTFGSAESLACKTGLCPDATKVRDQRRRSKLDRLPIFPWLTGIRLDVELVLSPALVIAS